MNDPSVQADLAEPLASAEPLAAAEPRASGYSWYVLGVLVILYFLNFVDRQILSILANDIKADLHLSDADLGFLYGTAFAVFYALFGLPLGRLADSWHRVRLISLGLALWSTMTTLSGFARSGTMLSVARIGVGVGEATASPSAYSLIADWFPQRMRATALAIYASGIYLGGGFSLVIGGLVVQRWNAAYPGGGPLGLHGWQAAFLVVGIPGLLMALWTLTLREPVRGAMDGIASPRDPAPFRSFFGEMINVVPPLTLIGAFLRGPRALLVNLAGAAGIGLAAWAMVRLTHKPEQFIFIGAGYYAVFSWAHALKARDYPMFKLILGSPAFLCTILAYGFSTVVSYAVSYWAAPYAERTFHIGKTELGLLIGGVAALAGFVGVIGGGWLADRSYLRHPAGRHFVALFGIVAPVAPILIAFTTGSVTTFYIALAVAGVFGPMSLGASAAASQSLVLPRMRGTATATFFLATTLIGLGLGPFMAGYISATHGDNLATGVISTLIALVPATIAVLLAIKLYPRAAASVRERAAAAGEVFA